MRAEGFEVLTGDLRSPVEVDRAVAGCEVVFHLGAAYRVEGLPIKEFWRINVGGTENVLRACECHPVQRIVHVSTVGVYGRISDPPADENHPLRHTDHYQETKLAGDRLARKFFAESLRGRGVVVRPTGVYGPGDLRFLKLFRALARRYFAFPGSSQCLYHPTYIDDLLNGFELVLDKDEALGEVYNLAGGRYLSLKDYIRTLASVLGVPEPARHVPLWPLKIAAHVCENACRAVRIEPPLFPRRLGFFHNHRAYAIEKARRELGYRPRVDLETGLERTRAWYHQKGLL
jgi:nucleoside-diphosphate-sugar epimerase